MKPCLKWYFLATDLIQVINIFFQYGLTNALQTSCVILSPSNLYYLLPGRCLVYFILFYVRIFYLYLYIYKMFFERICVDMLFSPLKYFSLVFKYFSSKTGYVSIVFSMMFFTLSQILFFLISKDMYFFLWNYWYTHSVLEAWSIMI